MRVTDVLGNRWQRSMRFLRQIGESISWRDDRHRDGAVRAHFDAAGPAHEGSQHLFFFLDHLSEESPFRLEDDTSWDTNMELGIYWGLKLVDRDEQIHGKSPNAKAFVMIRTVRTGAARSRNRRAGESARHPDLHRSASARATAASSRKLRGRPTSGPPAAARVLRSWIARRSAPSPPPAAASTSSSIANPIARSPTRSSKRRGSRAGFQGVQEGTEPLYWRFLVLAAVLVVVGALFLHERAELAIQVAGAAIVMLIVTTLTR